MIAALQMCFSMMRKIKKVESAELKIVFDDKTVVEYAEDGKFVSSDNHQYTTNGYWNDITLIDRNGEIYKKNGRENFQSTQIQIRPCLR